jgi:hypothetical protein
MCYCPSQYTEAINAGPLEATIHNLGKEIEHKTKDGQELQRRWIGKQTELVALQVGEGQEAGVCQSAGCFCWLMFSRRAALLPHKKASSSHFQLTNSPGAG